MMEAKERKIYHLVSRVQACWRGRKTRVSDILETLYLERKTRELSVIKIQAVWRGIRTRRSFLDAVKNSKYTDSDEFDYSPVNDADFLPMKLDFDESIDLNEEVDCSKGQVQSTRRSKENELTDFCASTRLRMLIEVGSLSHRVTCWTIIAVSRSWQLFLRGMPMLQAKNVPRCMLT
jgi:hypothetical protein